MQAPVRDALAVLTIAVEAAVDLGTVADLYGAVSGLRLRLEAKILAMGPEGSADRLLSALEAAKVTGWTPEAPGRGISPRYLYEHSASLGFSKHVGRALRFSEAGLRKWMQAR